MVEIVEGARCRARKLILDIGGATESLRRLLGLEARDPDNGPELTEVVVDLLLGGADIQAGDEHTGQVVGTVLMTVQVKTDSWIRIDIVVWLRDLVRDMTWNITTGLLLWWHLPFLLVRIRLDAKKRNTDLRDASTAHLRIKPHLFGWNLVDIIQLVPPGNRLPRPAVHNAQPRSVEASLLMVQEREKRLRVNLLFNVEHLNLEKVVKFLL